MLPDVHSATLPSKVPAGYRKLDNPDMGGATVISEGLEANVGATLTAIRSWALASMSGVANAVSAPLSSTLAPSHAEGEATEVDAASRRAMELVQLRNSLAHFQDFSYTPGEDTEIRRTLAAWMANNPPIAMSYLRQELLSGPDVLNMDGKLEAVLSSSEETPAYLRAELSHLFTRLLLHATESELQDAAARALGVSRLKATSAIPALRKAAQAAPKIFLKQQLEKTASDLERLTNGPVA